MIDLHSANDIDRISLEILKDSKSLDVFPTPVDNIINYCEISIDNSIDISIVHESYVKSATDPLFKALTKIRGIYDRSEKTIYLDHDLLFFRKNFVTLHEAGHGVLPWQEHIHDILEDDDNSIDLSTTEEFEKEANYFASVTLFQHDRFLYELNKLEFGIQSAIKLSKIFGGSIHATLIRFVQGSAKRCALLVLENVSAKGAVPKCYKRDFFTSKKFNETFGLILLPNEFGYTWPFTKNYYHALKGIRDGILQLKTENGQVQFIYQFFNNSHNALVLIFPAGEN